MKSVFLEVGSLRNHGPLNSNFFSITFTNLIGHCFNYQGYIFKPKIIFQKIVFHFLQKYSKNVSFFNFKLFKKPINHFYFFTEKYGLHP